MFSIPDHNTSGFEVASHDLFGWAKIPFSMPIIIIRANGDYFVS